MKLRYLLLFLGSITPLFVGCSFTPQPLMEKGSLFYGVSTHIYRVDFPEMKQTLVYEMPYIVNYLNIIDKNRFFITGQFYQKGIFIFNIQAEEASFYRTGDSPVYMPKHQKVLFFDGIKEEPRMGLFIADFDDPIHSAVEIKIPSLRSRLIVPISDDEVLIWLDYEHGNVGIYDIEENLFSPVSALKQCHFEEVWVKTQGVLCREMDETGELISQERVFMDFKGQKQEHPKLPLPTAIATHIEDNWLLFQNKVFQFYPRLGERGDLWGVNLTTGHKVKLLEDAPVSRGASIWYPKK